MRYEDSRKSMTSYQNLSVHLVIENFRPLMYEKVAPRQLNSGSLFRDTDIQHLLKSKRQETIQDKILTKHFYLNEY